MEPVGAHHSAASFAVGFSFTIGVLIVALRRPSGAGLVRILDVVAIGAAVAIPLVMSTGFEGAGALQRLMFLIAYVWYGAEALRLARSPETVTAVSS